MKKRNWLKVSGYALSTLLIVAIAAGDYAAYRYNSVITRWWSGTFTDTDNSDILGYTKEEAMKNSIALTKQTEAEGAVLLKNNGVLPTVKGKINLIGYSSNNPVYISAGSVAQSPEGDG